MKKDSDPPVLIVGAGPTGLMLALILARAGVPFRLIDQTEKRPPTSRALLLHSRTLELFDNLGLAERFCAAGHALRRVCFYHGHQQEGQVDFDRLESPYPYPLVLPQTETERLLAEELTRCGGRVECPAELLEIRPRSGGALAKVKDDQGVIRHIFFRYVAACDGAQSTVREILGLPCLAAGPPETFAVADLPFSGPLSHEAGHLIFHEEGLVFLIPYGPDYWRVLARLEGSAARDGVDTEELHEILRRRTGLNLPWGEPDWLVCYTRHPRHAERFQLGHIFLLGDAAHAHSPAGGQGLNTGLQDALNLGWKLALVLRGQAAPQLLATYEAERLPVAELGLSATERMLRLAEISSPAVAPWRERLLSLITGLPPIANALARDLAQLSVHYRQSPLTTEKRRRFLTRQQMRAGDRLPNCVLTRPDGQRTTLYEQVRGGGFHLFVVPQSHRLYGQGSYGQARHLVEGLQADFGKNLRVHWILTPAQSIALREVLPAHLVDLAGEAALALGLLPCGVALLRPDYYCAYAEPGFDLASLRLATLAFWNRPS